MYFEHCYLWTKDRKYAEKCAIDKTNKTWNKYVVIFKDWIWHYIVTKEIHLEYFKDKWVKIPKKEIEQLWFIF